MRYLKLLTRDKPALLGALFLLVAISGCVLGAALLGEEARAQRLTEGFHPPFDVTRGLADMLGTDQLGRSTLYRILMAGATSFGIAVPAALLAATIGTVIGVIAGYRGGFLGSLIMRLTDVIISFPGLLLAILFLYILEPGAGTIILLLVVARVPLYIRVARAETLEIRQRLFVDASRSLGASPWRIGRQDIVPIMLPTIVTLVALDVGILMLMESALSFLGVGLQSPSISWGTLVAEGRQFMMSAWWLTFFPGLLITLTAVSCNFLSNWLRIAGDPAERWRLELPRRQRQDKASVDIPKTVRGI
ncbi:ABC transporter permease [Homoserinimonas sp. A447]